MILHHIPRRIIGTVGLVSHHITTKEIAEIGSQSVLMVGNMEFEVQRLSRIFLVFFLSQITLLGHLVEHHVTTLKTTVRMADRIEIGGVFTQADEHSGLCDGEVLRILTEISVRSRLDTYRIVEKIEVVEIHGDNLILCIVTLQLNGYHPLYRLLQHALHHTVRRTGIELLSQLLGDGRTTTGTLLSQQTTLDDGTSQCDEIDTRMVVETGILGSHQRLDERRR